MINTNLKIFKNCVSEGCSIARVPFGELARSVGLSEFEIEYQDVTSPRELATKAFEHLASDCTDKHSMAILVAMVQFLDETLGSSGNMVDKVRGLRNIPSGSKSEFERWVEAWY